MNIRTEARRNKEYFYHPFEPNGCRPRSRIRHRDVELSCRFVGLLSMHLSYGSRNINSRYWSLDTGYLIYLFSYNFGFPFSFKCIICCVSCFHMQNAFKNEAYIHIGEIACLSEQAQIRNVVNKTAAINIWDWPSAGRRETQNRYEYNHRLRLCINAFTQQVYYTKFFNPEKREFCWK